MSRSEPTDARGVDHPHPDDRSLLRRFIEYQSERFPLLGNGLLIVVFTFSAISYSRVCRGAEGFIAPGLFALGAATAIYFFLLLRLFDEHKDAEEDARFRPYRPVPRGLITLAELRGIGYGLGAILLAANALVAPRLLSAIGLVIGYMLLMSREFFVRDWLKQHPIIYMLSHMVIMPGIDFYTTGLDWLHLGVDPASGLGWFLLVTFLNGMVIEVGRKIRAPEDEEVGVETYSALYGPKRATLLWIGIVAATYICALLASDHAGYGVTEIAVLTGILLLTLLPPLLFFRTPTSKRAKLIETTAGLWTIGMYLTLGGVPMVGELVG